MDYMNMLLEGPSCSSVVSALCPQNLGRPLDFRRRATNEPPCRCVRVVRVPAKATTTAKLRQWRALLIRKHGQVLGTVEARDRAAAERAAVAEFNLDADQRKRLVVQERGLKERRFLVFGFG